MDIKFGGKKKLVVLTGGLFLAFIFLLSTPRTLAYNSQTTHPDLIRETINFYELSMGKKLTDEQKQWISQGSIDEDKAPRWINHFYDPAFERGLSTTAAGFGYAGYSAKNWARFSSYQTLNPANLANLWTGNGPVISGSWWGDFSYEAAIKSYSKNKEKEAYIAMGNVLHIIADMTVPEHTRNDAHPGEPLPSYYENWTMNNSAGLTQDLGERIFNQGRKPVIYGDLGTYFNELAGYTNTHFFSPRTINSELYQKPKIVYEDGTFAYGYDENYQLFDLAVMTIDKSLKKNYSLKDENNQILQEYWLRLSRQAIINGAGIISLFVNEAEAAKKVELAKQKVDSGSTGSPQSSFISFISGLFSSSPGDSGPEPAMTIIAGDPQPTAPKINPAAPKITVPAPAVQSPAASPPAPPAVPKANPVVVPKTTPVVQAPAIPPPTPAPAPTPIVVYGGGGGGGTTADPSPNSSETVSYSSGDLVINEIMYDLGGDLGNTDTNREWIEIYNNSSSEIDLTGWKLNDGDDATNHGLNAPPKNDGQGSIILPVGGYTVVAEHATTFLTDHSGFSGTVIDTAEMNLKNSSSTITTLKIIASDGTTIDEVTYYNSWGGNGDGKTLEKITAGGASGAASNWGVSSATGGTPGAANNPIAFGEGGPVDGSVIAGTAGGTDISATTTISQNTTWILANSPYRLFFDSNYHPTVAAGAILTIEPGVKIIPWSAGGATALEIKGTLNAIATSGAPIIFTSKNDTASSTTPAQKGDWLNIVFSGSATGTQSNLDFVEFRYGGDESDLRPLKEMVKIIGATINIKNSKFENAQSIALRLIDSNSTVESSVFSDNACGISVDILKGDGNTDGGCSDGTQSNFSTTIVTIPQIKNNRFIRNRFIAIETRNSSTPIIDGNIFTDNGYPVRIDGAYPTIINSQLANSTTSPDIINGIAISGYTHFSQNYTLKKDLPYILEGNASGIAPYIDAGATLTIEPGTILKTDNTGSVLFVNGGLISKGALAEPVIFTSLKDVPQAGDWGNIRFNASSTGNFQNTSFLYGTPGVTNYPKIVTVLDKSSESGEVELTAPNFIGSVEQQFNAPVDANPIKISFSVHKKSGTSAQTMGVLLLADNGDQPGVILYNAGNYVVTDDYQVFNIEINKQIQANVKYWLQFNKVDIPIDTDWFFKTNSENYGILTTAVIGFDPPALNPQTLSLKITSTISVSVLNVLSIDAAATVVVE